MTVSSSTARVAAASGAAADKVSIICTARNAASTVESTIRSVVAQEFAHWEMIVVDDGSTDDTVAVVRRWAGADPRIRLVATGGVGRGRALNRALAEAAADLVANVDADDEVHPCLLRCQLEAMRLQPAYALVCTDWIRIVGAAHPVWPHVDPQSFAISDVTNGLALSNPIYHSSVMMRKAAILDLGGYSEDRHSKFDYDLWVRCAAAGLRLGRIRLPLAAQRIHPGQSYMHTRRLRNLLASLHVQWRAMRILGVRGRYLPLIPARFLWAILPLRLRLRLRDLAVSWHLHQIR